MIRLCGDRNACSRSCTNRSCIYLDSTKTREIFLFHKYPFRSAPKIQAHSSFFQSCLPYLLQIRFVETQNFILFYSEPRLTKCDLFLSRECTCTMNDLLQLAGECHSLALSTFYKIYIKLSHTKVGPRFCW